jgi:SWI/SNF-related matrix-associated actin-dependent regulator of chromatin subfamily B protein 1
MASPEDFAEVYTQELGLGGEFKYVSLPPFIYLFFFHHHHDSRFLRFADPASSRVFFCPTRTAIAHSIREQVQTYQKSLFLIGHPSDGTAVQDEELKQSFLPSLVSGARPVSEVQQFTPLLNYLSDGELERTEKERDKDLNKRRKRNTRGRRGIALPDREPIRTYRTPAIGFPELDAATLALAAAANAPMSRRAAAAAATLTIANMVASENGTPFMPQTMPSAAVPLAPTAASKEKPKGLFKAPAYPAVVLRPRAHVVAPTTSTAADVSLMPPVPVDNEAPPSSSSAAAPALDSKASKIISAKRAKELEREAKEKEFVDGQHPNFIDGVWHCSNCGCPESIAVGRRKGPLGDKSQCGTCGASCFLFSFLPFFGR